MAKIIEGRITSPFGYRRNPLGTDNAHVFHNGTDIAAAVGTPVFSPVDGTVQGVYDSPSGGLTVIIGGGGMRFGFCHLSESQVTVNERVIKGQRIAMSGNTGLSTGPHLHYTVKTGGRWVGSEYVDGQWADSAKFIEIG